MAFPILDPSLRPVLERGGVVGALLTLTPAFTLSRLGGVRPRGLVKGGQPSNALSRSASPGRPARDPRAHRLAPLGRTASRAARYRGTA